MSLKSNVIWSSEHLEMKENKLLHGCQAIVVVLIVFMSYR